jgi:hypothetical protein
MDARILAAEMLRSHAHRRRSRRRRASPSGLAASVGVSDAHTAIRRPRPAMFSPPPRVERVDGGALIERDFIPTGSPNPEQAKQRATFIGRQPEQHRRFGERIPHRLIGHNAHSFGE